VFAAIGPRFQLINNFLFSCFSDHIAGRADIKELTTPGEHRVSMLNAFTGQQDPLAVSALAFPLVMSDRVDFHSADPTANCTITTANRSLPWMSAQTNALDLVNSF
jgi:hypothetical protein